MIADVITIFPELIASALEAGVVGRARERGVVDLRVRNLRDYTDDRHRTVDDAPFGGGPGMVMKPGPLWRAIEAIAAERGPASAVVLMSPQGRTFTHAVAEEMSRLERLVIICGRYEGIDERVTEHLVTHEISIGDYVLTGGELPALVVLDAIARLVPGVVGDAGSVAADSFVRGLLDHPHYTRPAEFRGHAVPATLMSGDHAAIDRWRLEQRIRRTAERRPELLERADLSKEERREWEQWKLQQGTSTAPAAAGTSRSPNSVDREGVSDEGD